MNGSNEVEVATASKVLSNEKLQEVNDHAEKIIRNNVAISAGIGLIPIPLVDMAALLAQQLVMIGKIGNIYAIARGEKNEPFSKDLLQKTVVSLIGSTLPNTSLKFAAFSLLKSIPVVGSSVAVLSVPILAGSMTYAVGKVFNLHFAQGGSLLSFDPIRYQDYLQEELEMGKKVAMETTLAEPAKS